ncbi:MAG: general secretion pathway protein GspB [Psychromonas sp.]|nr:general secretion pathway protein GspB [Psychromonas sp.]
MSTILRALQKNKFPNLSPIRNGESNQNVVWRSLLLALLVVIIILLCLLLYTRLFPRPLTKNAIKPLNKDPITKIFFLTKKIPTTDNNQKVIYIEKPQKTAKHEVAVVSHSVAKRKEIIKNHFQRENASIATETGSVSPDVKPHVVLSGSSIGHQKVNTERKTNGSSSTVPKDIQDMSSIFQQTVPAIRYQSHVYSSEKKYSWIKVNDEVLKVGDVDSSGKLKVVDIQPQKTIFQVGRKNFSLGSLVDWNVNTNLTK